MNILKIYKAGLEATDANIRYKVEKWSFHDAYMGEQYVSFDVKSHEIILWEVGDYCVFRGQHYLLSYIPSCTQNARIGDSGKSFEYTNIKLVSLADELTRCEILDVVPTTGDYDQYAGTNYTGSAVFSLYCGETVWTDGQGVTHHYAPVHTLTDRIKANLDRLYPNAGWQIHVNDEACMGKEFTLSLNHWTATQAISEINKTFKCNFIITGRTIYVGYAMPELTSTQEIGGEPTGDGYYLGYGKGYPTRENSGTGLFCIKKTSDPNQNIVTRLRAYGSRKNLPYRYYMKSYDLPQSMQVYNLQLPDTFLPFTGVAPKKRVNDPNNKTIGNSIRGDEYNHVLGETNDAYIDKDNDAASCAEGIREASAAWDGTDSNLEEIYPTIQGMTYGELRAANVPDISGNTGPNSYQTPSVYHNDERVDEILAVDSDTNIGNGVISLESMEGRKKTFRVDTRYRKDTEWEVSDIAFFNGESYSSYTGETILLYEGTEAEYAGKYTLAPTHQNVWIRFNLSMTETSEDAYLWKEGYKPRTIQVPVSPDHPEITYGKIVVYNALIGWGSVSIRYLLVIRPVSGQAMTQYLATRCEIKDLQWGLNELEIPAIPDFAGISEIELTEPSTISVYITVSSTFLASDDFMQNCVSGTKINLSYSISPKIGSEEVDSNLVWAPVSGNKFMEDEPFHLCLKDLGFNLKNAFTVEDGPVQIYMTSGNCVGRTFDVNGDISSVEYYTDSGTTKKGWRVELKREADENLGIYFPNEYNTIQPGDKFVLLNIELPEVYIRAAEVRLLRAAQAYLADNCSTRFTYEPSIDDIFIQRNYERCLANNEVEKSILWRLYAGERFTFRGIPVSNNQLDPLPLSDITISQVEIKFGEKDTPQVSIQLNEDTEQSTVQKLAISVDRLYNSIGGFARGAESISAFYELLTTEGRKMFLSRLNEDHSAEKIFFDKGAVFGNTFESGVTGADIDENGNTEVGSLRVRDTARLNGDVHFGKNDLEKDISGGGVYEDGNGVHLEVDYMKVHKKAIFNEVEIQESTYIGGKLISTPANGFTVTDVAPCDQNNNVLRVENDGVFYGYDFDNANINHYRLYFNDKDKDSGEQSNMTWKVGDQAFCQTFNLGGMVDEGSDGGSDASDASTSSSGSGSSGDSSFGNRYWWRLVTIVAKDMADPTDEVHYGHWYIAVSLNDCDALSDIPNIGDKVVMLGHRRQVNESLSDAATRQAAIIMASAGEAGEAVPYIKLYRGISNYNLSQAEEVFGVSRERIRMIVGEADIVYRKTDGNEETLGQIASDAGGSAARLDHIDSDGWLSVSEKKRLVSEWAAMEDTYKSLTDIATELGITVTISGSATAGTAKWWLREFKRAHQALDVVMGKGDYIPSGDPYGIWVADLNNDTQTSTFRGKSNAAYLYIYSGTVFVAWIPKDENNNPMGDYTIGANTGVSMGSVNLAIRIYSYFREGLNTALMTIINDKEFGAQWTGQDGSMNYFFGKFTKNGNVYVPVDAMGLKVHTTDGGLQFYNNGQLVGFLGLSMNEGSSEAKIKADNISLEGLVTANNNFQIGLDGSMKALRGEFSGFVTGVPTIITALNVANYIKVVEDPYYGFNKRYILELDWKMIGSTVIFYQTPNDQVADPDYPQGYGEIWNVIEYDIIPAFISSHSGVTANDIYSAKIILNLPFTHDPMTHQDQFLWTYNVMDALYYGYSGQTTINCSQAVNDSGGNYGTVATEMKTRYGNLVVNARQMLGNKITIYDHTSRSANNGSISMYVRGVTTNFTKDYNDDDDGTLFESGYDWSYNTGIKQNVLLLECKEATEPSQTSDNTGNIGWAASESTRIYFNRYTLGLEDITESESE